MRAALLAAALLSCSGCVGHFEEARAAGIKTRYDAIALGAAPAVRDAEHCSGIDHDHRTFVYAAWITGVTGGGAGTVAGVVQGTDETTKGLRIGLGVSAAVLAATSVTTGKLAADTANQWARECSR